MSAAALAVRGLTVDFGNHVALRDIALELPEGAFATIVGPNGSGKSTLLKTALGLVRPTAGCVELLGHRPTQVPHDWIGYVPQLKTLDRHFPALAVELVVTGLRRGWPVIVRKEERRRALAALEQVGGARLAERSVAQLSGGELQRVYLARALVREPRIVMLDEPATGIDVRGEADFYHLLERYHADSGATVIMVTHDWAAAYHHASHAVLLDSRLIAFGPPATALTDDRMREAFGHVGHEHQHRQTVAEPPHV